MQILMKFNNFEGWVLLTGVLDLSHSHIVISSSQSMALRHCERKSQRKKFAETISTASVLTWNPLFPLMSIDYNEFYGLLSYK